MEAFQRWKSPAMNVPSQQSRAWLLFLWIYFNSLNELSHLQSSEAYLPKCTWILWKGWQPSIPESWDSLLMELCDVLNLEIGKRVVTWSVTRWGTGWGAEGDSGLWTAFVQHEVKRQTQLIPLHAYSGWETAHTSSLQASFICHICSMGPIGWTELSFPLWLQMDLNPPL